MEHFTSFPNVTMQNFAKEDFWYDLFDAPYIKYCILCISILTLICLVPMYIFIFLHIQAKRFRTVLTYGENIVYLYFYFFLCVPFCLDVIRIFSGPMSETICWLTIFFKNFGVFGGQFGFVVCITLRYLYVIVYKSVGVFDDDFFGWFLHLLSIVFSFVAAFIKVYVPGKMGLNYYMCTGEDPEPYSNQRSKFPVSLLISLVTLLVYTGVSFRLAFAQRMRNLMIKTRKNPEGKGWLSSWVPYVSNLAWSTLDLCNLYICMTIVVGDSILWNMKTKELTSYQIKTTTEGQVYFLLHQYILVMLGEWCIVLNLWIRNEALRKFVWNMLKDYFVVCFFVKSSKRRVHPL